MSEDELRVAIYGIYEAGLRLKPPYKATRFMQMMEGPGGPLAAAHELLIGPAEKLHDGFLALVYDYKRPDITVEWVGLQPKFHSFFTPDELEVLSHIVQLALAAGRAVAGNDRLDV